MTNSFDIIFHLKTPEPVDVKASSFIIYYKIVIGLQTNLKSGFRVTPLSYIFQSNI